MAISGFGRGKNDGVSSAPPAPSGGGNLSAFIDQGSEFEGKLTFKDTVRIDGSFQGEITSENTLVVGETGTIEAIIRSNTVEVSGTVVGDIIASRQIVLHKSARVQGDLKAPSLIIEEGAIFNGSLEMKRPDEGRPELAAVGVEPKNMKQNPNQHPNQHQNQHAKHAKK